MFLTRRFTYLVVTDTTPYSTLQYQHRPKRSHYQPPHRMDAFFILPRPTSAAQNISHHQPAKRVSTFLILHYPASTDQKFKHYQRPTVGKRKTKSHSSTPPAPTETLARFCTTRQHVAHFFCLTLPCQCRPKLSHYQ